MTKLKKQTRIRDPDPISVALMILSVAGSLASVVGPVQVWLYERRRRRDIIEERKQALKNNLYKLERLVIELEGMLREFKSVLHQNDALQTKFLPAQTKIAEGESMKELSRLKRRIFGLEREIDEVVGRILGLMSQLFPEQIQDKFSSLREAFIDNYRLALHSETFGKFIEDCSRLLEVGRHIVTEVREYYDRSLS
ncbi:MAG: hypothetical protein QW328_07545 [Nitrososphaerota archaeon]